MRRRALALALATALASGVASAAPPAPSPADVERARTFFNAGAQAYANARYADAARSFERAYALAPRTSVLFSLAQAERKEFFVSNDGAYLKRAIAHYQAYLDAVPSGGRRSDATEAKADLEARLARLDPAVVNAASAESAGPKTARVTVYSATPGARVSIDGAPPEELPYFGDLPKGTHRVRVFAKGYVDAVREVSGDRPVDIPVDVTLKDKPALVTVGIQVPADVYIDGRLVARAPISRPIPVEPGFHVLAASANGRDAFQQEVLLGRDGAYRFEPTLETSGQRVVAWTLLGAGAAGLVTGGVFAVLALGQEGSAKDVLDRRAQGNIRAEDLDAYNAAVDRRDTFRTVAVVSASAGAAVAAGGALLYFFDTPTIAVVPPRSIEPEDTPHPERSLELVAAPWMGHGAGGASLFGRF